MEMNKLVFRWCAGAVMVLVFEPTAHAILTMVNKEGDTQREKGGGKSSLLLPGCSTWWQRCSFYTKTNYLQFTQLCISPSHD